jgi:hypothetical protein
MGSTMGLGDGFMTTGLGDGFIMTIDTGEPESITLGGVTRVSRPTPMRALSTGRGDGTTVGPLL